MKKYKIIRTQKADEMLHRVVLYVSEAFGVDVALEKLDEIEERINMLSLEPEMGVTPKYDVLRRQGYRVLILPKDLVFYKVDHPSRTVCIYAIFDARQDYLDILQGL